MTTRERTAWCAFAVSVVALAATLTLRPDTPSTASRKSAVNLDDGRLASIDARLARIESTLRVNGVAATAQSPPPPAPTRAEGSAKKTFVAEAEPAGQDTAASQQNLLAATALVEHAIGAGYWSRKDAETWRAVASGMRTEDRYELQRRLIVEMNADRVRTEPGAPPL